MYPSTRTSTRLDRVDPTVLPRCTRWGSVVGRVRVFKWSRDEGGIRREGKASVGERAGTGGRMGSPRKTRVVQQNRDRRCHDTTYSVSAVVKAISLIE